MLISCRTSSYFSSIAKRASNKSGPRPPAPLVFNPMQQVLFFLPQGVNFVSMLTGAELLQPVDFALDGGALALPPQPFNGPGALHGRGRRGGLSSDAGDELGVQRT